MDGYHARSYFRTTIIVGFMTFTNNPKLSERCQERSVVRFLRIDPMVSGSNPTSAKLSLRVRESPALCNSRRRNHEVWSHRDGGPGHCLIKLLSVQISAFDISVESCV